MYLVCRFAIHIVI